MQRNNHKVGRDMRMLGVRSRNPLRQRGLCYAGSMQRGPDAWLGPSAQRPQDPKFQARDRDQDGAGSN